MRTSKHYASQYSQSVALPAGKLGAGGTGQGTIRRVLSETPLGEGKAKQGVPETSPLIGAALALSSVFVSFRRFHGDRRPLWIRQHHQKTSGHHRWH